MNIKVFAEKEIPGVYAAVPDKNGYYRISKLPPNKDLKVITACWNVSSGCGRIAKEGIRVERGKTTKGIDFVIPDDPTGMSGQALSPEGAPLRANLTFWKNSEDMGNLECDVLGNYSMRALEPGNYRVHVGYGNEQQKISDNVELHFEKGKMIRMDIVISDDSIEFNLLESQEDAAPTSSDFFFDENQEFMAELILSENDAYSEEMKDRVLDAYLNDIRIKIKSNCLPDGHPDSIRMRMIDRLFKSPNPIYIIIKNSKKYSIIEQKGEIYRIEKCGSTLKSSSIIYLYPGAFENRCGSFASVLFHELLHVAGLRDENVYPNTQMCYGSEAVETPLRFQK
jgi:hypothetical protein